MSLVTVVIPTYNKAAYVRETLHSIHNQSYRDWQLLIMDDASTDGTVSIVRESTDPARTQIVVNSTNQGICHVLNQALKRIHTKYFIQVDGDDWITPDTIEVLLGEMERGTEQIALAYGNTSHWHEENGTLLFHKKVKHRSFLDRYDFATYDPMVQPRFYRTSCVKAVGGWEIDRITEGRMMEDRRMLLRLLDRFEFTYVDRDLYHFRYHEHSLSQDRNAAIYNRLRKMYTDQALKRWGDQYRAEAVGPSHLWQSIVLTPSGRRKE